MFDLQAMPSAARVAVIDIGSNSIKLLVARAAPGDSAIEALFAETIETRISGGIGGELPRLAPEAMEAGIRALSELLRLALLHKPGAIRIVATSAVRDALNGRDFARQVQTATGHAIDILSGPEEARLIGRGLATDPQLTTLDRFLQIDLGGGSLELIHFSKHRIEQAISLQLGAVRLSERFLPDREAPLDPAIAQAIQAHVSHALQNSGMPLPPGQPVVATGGAVVVTRAVLAAEAGIDIETRSPCITLEEITRLRRRLARLNLHQRIAVPHLPAARADIFPTALLTIETVLQAARADRLTHSFHNLRYGIAAELLENR